MAGALQEQNNASGVPGATGAPLLLLNGHVCALSPEPPRKERRGNEQGGFQLREPYEWESDEEAAGLLLPRWMWSVVGGETVSKIRGGNVREGDMWRIVAVVIAPTFWWRTDCRGYYVYTGI